MAETFPCQTPFGSHRQDELEIEALDGGLDGLIGIAVNSRGSRQNAVFLTPEDALRFAKAVLDVADEVAETAEITPA